MLLTLGVVAAPALGQESEDRWSDAIAKFARQDEETPYPHGGVVFVGSSSIRLWDLEKSFPELEPPPLNRGFGGSQISDSIRHAKRLVLRHRPRLVVMYAGDNDIAAGKTPAQVHAGFKAFSAIVLKEMPDTHLAFISIKPSLKRWEMRSEMREANQAIRKTCETNERLTFIDIWRVMLGERARPRAELFREDGLHLNGAGYRVWEDRINLSLTMGAGGS